MELQSTQRKLNDCEANLRKMDYELSTCKAQVESLKEDRERIKTSTQVTDFYIQWYRKDIK